MDIPSAIIIGIVQGITEFLPVSSDGHLTLAEHWLGGIGNGQDTFAINVLVHLGSLLAILAVFRKEILALVLPRPDWQRVFFLAYLTIPTVIVGVIIKFFLPEEMEHTLLNSPWLACAGLLVTSAILMLGQRKHEERVEFQAVSGSDWRRAGMIGVAQALAILPGVSRSGSTISTALMLGWKRESALTLSFLMGVIAITGAGTLEAKHISTLPLDTGLAAFLSSLVFSFIGLTLVRKVVIGGRLRWFALYTALLGIGGLIALIIQNA